MNFLQRSVSGAWNSTPMMMFRKLCCNVGGFATAAIAKPFYKIIDEISGTKWAVMLDEQLKNNAGYQVFFKISQAIHDRINKLYEWL